MAIYGRKKILFFSPLALEDRNIRTMLYSDLIFTIQNVAESPVGWTLERTAFKCCCNFFKLRCWLQMLLNVSKQWRNKAILSL